MNEATIRRLIELADESKLEVAASTSVQTLRTGGLSRHNEEAVLANRLLGCYDAILHILDQIEPSE